MNTISMASYRSSQRLNPLALLAQLSSRQANGCLQVSNNSVSWFIYLEQGRLVFASDSADPFERLDRHLRRLGRQIPTLVSAVRVQVRLIFESDLENQIGQSPDYQAICWLVNQQYLNTAQAATLIEALAEEVLGPLLSVKEGAYQLIDQAPLANLPKFCQLDLRTLVERCYEQLRRQQSVGSPNSLPEQRSVTGEKTSTPKASEQAEIQKENPPIHTLNDVNRTVVNPQKNTGKSTYTIACIDDSPTVLNAINSFLDDKSFSVVMINDPVRALMQVVRIKPDLILLDVAMPNLDGYELCSLLRKHSMFKNTPIVMVTGNTGFIDRAKAKLVRASGYLTKPFNQSELLKMVFKHLS